MTIWSSEIKELEKLPGSFTGLIPELEKELGQLIKSEDPNVLMLYSRRCLEVIITDLCECELKRPRKTEPLKGIIDKLNKEEKVPSHIITSMDHVNGLSTYGAHPKDFDPEQVKPVLSNLAIILKWYLKYKESQTNVKPEGEKPAGKYAEAPSKVTIKKKKNLILLFFVLLVAVAAIAALIKFNIISFGKQAANLANLEKSIAVLPFKNDSPDTTNVYFINGLMEDILNNLQKIKDLRVISRTSVEQYRNQNKSIPEIAKELGINYILEGSGQKLGNKIHLSVQLLRATKEGHLWGNSYEQEIQNATEIFNIQRQISEAIATELKAALTPQEKQLIDKIPTANMEAYEAYLKGMIYWRKLAQNDLDIAMKYFQLALEKDPEYALAYTGIGFVWAGLGQMGYVSPAEAFPKMNAALTTALKLDSTLDQVHYSLACNKTWVEWDWKSGEAEFQKALAINPNHAEAHAYYSHFLNIVGRPKEAMDQIELALRLDPLNPLIKGLYCVDLFSVGRYEDAIAAAREALKMDPASLLAQYMLSQSLILVKKYEEGIENYKTALSLFGFNEVTKAFDSGYSKAGYIGAINQAAESLIEISKTKYVLPFLIADLYFCSGNLEQTLNWLERAYEEHDPNLPYYFNQKPFVDSLGNNLRFQALAKKMNLPYK